MNNTRSEHSTISDHLHSLIHCIKAHEICNQSIRSGFYARLH